MCFIAEKEQTRHLARPTIGIIANKENDVKMIPAHVHCCAQVDYGDLLQAIQEACQEIGLQAVDNFVAKCIQLYETTLVRHGLMLVGPTMGGKTACYRVLQKV